jgi:hypothetical protein
MRKRELGLALLVAALAALAAPRGAEAQRITSPYRFIEKKKDLGVFVGYMSTDRGTANLGPKSGPLAGVQLTLRLSGPINIGFYGAYFASERDIMDPSTDEGLQAIGSTDLNLVLLAGRLQLHLTGARTWNNMVPFVYGAVGAAFDVTNDPSCLLDLRPLPCQVGPRERFDFGTSIMGQLGLGTFWLPRQKLGLRLTLDDTIWQLPTPDGFLDPGANVDPVPPPKEWTNNLQVTVGLYYWF